MLRIQREDEDAARGIRKRVSTGGLTHAFCLVVGLVGITLTALGVVLHGGRPPLASIFFVVILCAGLANRPSKNDDQSITAKPGSNA